MGPEGLIDEAKIQGNETSEVVLKYNYSTSLQLSGAFALFSSSGHPFLMLEIWIVSAVLTRPPQFTQELVLRKESTKLLCPATLVDKTRWCACLYESSTSIRADWEKHTNHSVYQLPMLPHRLTDDQKIAHLRWFCPVRISFDHAISPVCLNPISSP